MKIPSEPESLTSGQTSFGLLLAQDCSTADAWVRAGLGAYSRKKGEELAAHPEVVRIIEEIRQRAEDDALMNKNERRRFLARIVRTAPKDIGPDSDLCQGFEETALGPKIKILDKLKAIDLDSKLCGDLDKKADDQSSALSDLIAGLRG